MSGGELARRAELGAFLRARRAAVKPADVGLAETIGKRRTPGLRREEVAQLAGVGLAWYTWLEQGRVVSTSAQVIDSIARALLLEEAAHRHVRALANLPLPQHALPDPIHESELDARLGRLVANLLPNAACVIDQRFDICAWNLVYGEIWRELETIPTQERNLLWLFFNDPGLRDLVVDWDLRAQALIAQFRAVVGRNPQDSQLAQLVARLSESSPYFRERWSDYQVGTFTEPRHVIRHHLVGEIHLDLAQLRLVQYPSLTLILQSPVTDSDRQALHSLLAEAEKR
ncbi:hypothetical protein BKG77_01650 [Mycobacteroides chelonae]|uniref:MmyB-like transcription regulator ligand binding domain-containing protein n=1 Tax=Mycobacteroides chelonae TaxID=1774 RepID=A0A1S1LVP7_MYCCH|nr:helix-turn-helix transcriptional regulator [Mycobacteroides chelonae]OHU28271.1 hypothetical protein BKG77_01650 [Mycobacteroides chelonae]OHU63682.1 hypothetical protein BKG85_09265 [Mycobacteroides chelonae]OHU76429.1 hypothetical protein BKG84_24340 [Mycobacteroides chelonae]QQG88314.1 helix-turn-helix domain-containing protein [Mycobacteroides chelonae]QQG93131.1 helix-turn-helix domain-containing protein [Mycobacteroides chelonae]